VTNLYRNFLWLSLSISSTPNKAIPLIAHNSTLFPPFIDAKEIYRDKERIEKEIHRDKERIYRDKERIEKRERKNGQKNF